MKVLKKGKEEKKSRKQLRKEMRKQKKVNRNEYYTNRKKPGQFVLNPNREQDLEANNNKAMQPKLKNGQEKPVVAILNNKVLSTEQVRKKEQREQKKIEKQMKKRRNRQLLEANKEEDLVIKQLEKQLGLNKRKSKSLPKSFTEEGLDYLLEVCDPEIMKNSMPTNTDLYDDNFEEDFSLMMEKPDINRNVDDENDEDEFEPDNYSDEESENNNSEEGEDLASESNSDMDEMAEVKTQQRKKVDKTKKISHKNDLVLTNSEEEYENSDENEDIEESDDEISLKDNMKRKKKQTKIKKKIKSKHRNVDDSEKMSEEENMKELESEDSFEDVSNAEDGIEDEKQIKGAVKVNSDGTWEDIYGRLRSKDGSVITNDEQSKYVPPAAREKLTDKLGGVKSTEKLNRLRRQLKGLLNRLAESNLHFITTQIEALYMNNSRNDMNDTITKLITESLVAETISPERLLIEHIVLIVILHANVGTEVGAHFLQQVIKMFDEFLLTKQEVEDKTLDNVVNILAQLYNFKIFDGKLMYEILQKLTDEFSEKCIECILHILKSVGFTLRKDDPLALKNVILDLQKRAVSVPDNEKDDPRLKFMLDILLAIKNNNVTKIPNYDVSYSEHLKKVLKGHIRKGNVVTQLNISLEDLLKAHERGKWWVVGSAWTGGDVSTEENKKSSNKPSYSLKLLELAKKQRMNTDTRRNIFCIIMSAEDYLDAFEKILKLGLKNQQEREIINVILHCCLQEKKYNPYYAYLTQKFCEYDRKYQMTIKYSIWDKLKALTDHSGSQISNLAKLLIHLFVEKGLPISILKIIQFSDIEQITLRFMRQILIGILVHHDEECCLEVFAKLNKSDKLKMFRESLKLFIHHFLLRNMKTEGIPVEQKTLLEGRAKTVERILSTKDKF